MICSHELWSTVLGRSRSWQIAPFCRREISVNTAINRELRKGGRQRPADSRRGDAKLRKREVLPVKEKFSLKFNTEREEILNRGTPVTIPYTTAASEFLYGTSAVKAALETRRRRCYKLYVYSGEQREGKDEDLAVRKLALQQGIMVQRVKGHEIRLMDKMSGGRPHNGLVLEASPLPKLPVLSLGKIQNQRGAIPIELDHQSREEEKINGKALSIPCQPKTKRYPFVVLLDGILDSGNLGAVIRSAFFLGVDALIMAGNTAPMSPVALKASAGAAEHLPLLTARQPYDFIDACRANGWHVYAADASQESGRHLPKPMLASDVVAPLLEHPCILMLGSEGDGIRRRLLERSNARIIVSGSRSGQGGVDSLNVSVAAGILIDSFLRQPGSRIPETPRQKRLDLKDDRLF